MARRSDPSTTTARLPAIITENLFHAVRLRLSNLLQLYPKFTLAPREFTELFHEPKDLDLLEAAERLAPNLVSRVSAVHDLLVQDTLNANVTWEVTAFSTRRIHNSWMVFHNNPKIRPGANPEHVAALIRYIQFCYEHGRMLRIAGIMCGELCQQATTPAQMWKAWPNLCQILRGESTIGVPRKSWSGAPARASFAEALGKGEDATRARSLPDWSDAHRKAQSWVTLKLNQSLILDEVKGAGNVMHEATGMKLTVQRAPMETFIIGDYPIKPIY